MLCPCGSKNDLSECCGPYLDGKVQAPTAEALMRARYTAHVQGVIPFILRTVAPENRGELDENAIREWASKSEWVGLDVISTDKGGPDDKKGTVEFVARYKSDGKVFEHHEVSKFRKDAKTSEWFFVDGEAHVHKEGEGHHHGESHKHGPQAPVVRESPKVGRNDPCPCGSGKKYKKCCMA